MSKYNAEQFIVENLVELPKTKKEMIWCLNEFLKDTVKSISDDDIENMYDLFCNWYEDDGSYEDDIKKLIFQEFKKILKQ